MPTTYEDETKERIKVRMRNAEMKRTQQIKRRNTVMMGIGGVVVIILLVVVLCISCSSGKSGEKETTSAAPETTAAEPVTVVETQPETTASKVFMYTTDALNLRKEPSTDAEVITVLDAGKKVEVLSEEGKWCHVKVGKKKGYVSKDYLSNKK